MFGRSALAVALAVPFAVQAQLPPDLMSRPKTIPANWIDLPEAPFVAATHKGAAALLNRSKRTFVTVAIGCVQQEGAVAKIEHELFGYHVDDGTIPPGEFVDSLLQTVNIIEFYELAAGARRCPQSTRSAVTGATEANGAKWSANGTPWPK